MATISLSTDNTTLVLNGTVINDFSSGDILTLAPVNPSSSHINSSNGGVSIFERIDKDVYDLTIRVQHLSDSDAFMNNVLNQSPTTVLGGSLKENYTKNGENAIETWLLESGSIITQPTVTINSEDGNGLAEYVVRFRTAKRSI